MLKLSQKKRKALLALAVAATVLGANNAFAASVHDKAISESNNYGASMRTYWQNQGVYDAKTHTYTFNEDITLKPKTSEQNLNFWTPLFGGIYVAGYNPVTIDMQGHRLDVAMNMDPVAQGAVFNPGAISPNVLHVTSSSLTINNVKGMELSAAGPGLATGNITGIYLAGTNQEGSYHDGKGLSSLTINNADGWDNAIKFHSSQDQVENGIYVWKNSGSADLKISGLVDMYVGNGSSVITVRGGDYTGDTQGVPTAFKTSTGRAANVVGGLLSVNSKLENGEIVASDANRDVQIDGNICVDDVRRDQGTVTLGLNTADSYFKGIMYTNGGEGDAHMILQNGAQWTNTSTSQGDWDYHGSTLKQFVGSEGAANTGYIFQKDNAALNLGNYSGYTTVFYEHNNDGTKTADYTAGNTIINTAKEGSNITLITDNVDVNNEKTVNAALNALAGKLYYNAAKNGEGALDGMAVIAEGLTASSKALKTAGIYFNDQTGQGTTTANINQTKTDFTTTLTGVQDNDTEYAEANVIAEDGTYKFKKDTTITTTDKNGADLKQAARINAGKTLTFNTNVEGSDTVYALGASSADGVTVNAGKLVINGSSTNGRVEGINVGQGAQSKDKPMKLTINGDTEFNMKGIGYTLGLYANGNSEVTFNGNVTARGNENSEWGLTSEEGAFGYYGCSLVYSGSNYSLQMGPKVTINGDVNAKIDGNALFANGGHAKLTINGGGNIEINKDNEHNYYAMIAESGTTSMNVNLDENYDAVSARDNKLVLKGNVGASTGAINANEPELYTKVNLGLATADSEWTGIAYNGFNDEGNSAYGSDKKFYGAINVFLQNGATWNNEQWGEAVDQFEGSHVAKFVGGESEAKAGNIFQKDSGNLTIDNYSGNTNIFYAHTGNGEAAENYAAGDTVIKGAASNSVVSLITDNSGINMDNADSVNNVLKALAGKLTYSNYVNGENNLTGYVKIADGLTASSKAMQTGDISFSSKDGKGSLKDGSIAPGLTYPDTQTPESSKLNSGITGDAKADYQYKKDGILKEDGTYVFTQDPTKIEVESGAAVDSTENNINIDTTKAKLELKGATGINANGADVTVKGNTDISGNVGINAANGNVTLNGSTVISGTDAAINAGENANVNVNGNNSALTINGSINANGGNITVDSGNASSTITGDINAANGGSVVISLIEKNSVMNGGYNVDGNSSIALSLANGATWNLTDGEEAAGMSLLRIAKAPAAAPAKGLTINGGKTEAETGYLNMTKRSKALQIANYSGWETIIYNHDNKGSEAQEFKSGNTVISNAKEGSGVILFTDSNNININSQAEVEAVLKVLAEKVQYTDHAANGANLKGKVRIAEGLTSAGKTGVMKWDETTGIGKFDPSSIKWGEIYNGDYETLVMKGVRSAATTSMHSWRDNMQDTYTGADLADADGIFAKALGGKTSSDVKGVKDDNTYRGVQVGYDKALANGWHAGVAFDYRDGDSNYLLGGKGDNQLYSFGVYGVKNFEDQSYLRVAAKAGRVENEYDVYNEIRSLKLHGDYKANAYGLTMEYGKTFGTEASYFTPKAQLTWSQVGAKDYTAHTDNATMQISQDSYSSFVGRLGFEAGVKSEKGRVYAGLFAAHEFNGDISASYFANDGDRKHTSFNGEETWMEMKLGGTYDFSNNAHLYADFAKDFNGNFERKWKMNAGIRFEF